MSELAAEGNWSHRVIDKRIEIDEMQFSNMSRVSVRIH
jgi:hypothetical protein